MPTGKNNATFSSTPTCMPRSRSRSKLSRLVRCSVGGAGSERGASATAATSAMAPQTRNGQRTPNGPTRTPPMTGPVTNPASSTPPRRPNRSATWSSDMLAAMARAAGRNNPFDNPTTPRATTKPSSDDDPANSTLPTTATRRPAMSRVLECPRSASGASNSCPRKPTTMPDPAISPRPASANPYASCRSDSTENTTLLAMPTAAVARRSAYQPWW